MKPRSNTLVALPLLVSACAMSASPDASDVLDAALLEDAASPDASPRIDVVSQSAAPFAAVVSAEARSTVAYVANYAAEHAADTNVASLAAAVREAAATSDEGDRDHDASASTWSREIRPESLDGVATKPFDPSSPARGTCRGIMSEGQLCTCLTGPINPEYADSYADQCSHVSLGVPGFGVFTDRSHSTYVTAETDGGWYALTYVDTASYSAYSVSGGRLMRAGTLDVLAIELQQDGGCTNEGWERRQVQLCALRDLDSPRFGHCVGVPLSTVDSVWHPETDVTTETRSRTRFRLTAHGTVVIRASGRIRHDESRKALGEHRL